jgi:hypothetical protein
MQLLVTQPKIWKDPWKTAIELQEIVKIVVHINNEHYHQA